MATNGELVRYAVTYVPDRAAFTEEQVSFAREAATLGRVTLSMDEYSIEGEAVIEVLRSEQFDGETLVGYVDTDGSLVGDWL